jgi:MFS family permease
MRYVINLAVLSLLAIPFLFVKSIPLLALALFINGLSIAPIIINAYAIVEKAVPAAQLTETLAWVTAGMPIGGATASALAGWVIDNHGTETAFWVPLGFTLAALCATLAHFTTYRPLISYPQHRD